MKFVLKYCLMIILLTLNPCYAQVVLRFQPDIDDRAERLGDVLIIGKSDVPDTGGHVAGAPLSRLQNPDWGRLPLDSHPTPNEIMTKAQIIDWMTQRLGHFNYSWQGKTQIRIRQSSQSSGTMLIEKAKTALMKKLRPHYVHVDVTPLSPPKDSSYALKDIKVKKIELSFPTPKRVCVWLSEGDKTRIAVWFKVNAYAQALVANHDIHYNTPLETSSFSLKERNIAGLKAAPVLTLPQEVWLKSSMDRDTILLESQLKKPPLVTHGQHIKVATHNHSITVVMDGIALSDGYLGESITVKNPLNQKTFDARITGFQQAEITS